MAAPTFTCDRCGTTFTLPRKTLDRFPGWTPKRCRACRDAQSSGAANGAAPRPAQRKAPGGAVAVEENLTLDEVLAKYTRGPRDGVFTDGSATPNPGPGGWGAVYVRDGEIVDQAHGHDGATTNNRMELTALIEGARLVPKGTPITLYTDSKLCVNTINDWAKGWKARGWKRKTGEIANLDLVRHLYDLLESRPELRLEWIKAHSGNRWNEYADSLSTAYSRTKL